MMLYERGALELTDPVSRYIPAFADQRVYRGGSAPNPGTVAGRGPDARSGTCSPTPPGSPTASTTRTRSTRCTAAPATSSAPRAASTWPRPATRGRGLPLLFQPGTEWNYSVATDVLGRVVEVASGQSLDRVLRRARSSTRSGWTRPGSRSTRTTRPAGHALRRPTRAAGWSATPRWATRSPASRCSSPAAAGWPRRPRDYHRFTQMLARGGELDGVRLLGPRTVAYATRNHLPGGADLDTFGRPIFAESAFTGVGFGLGFSVVLDAAGHPPARERGRVRLGRAGQHRVLGRPGRGPHRPVLHPADAVERLPDPLPAPDAGPPGVAGS